MSDPHSPAWSEVDRLAALRSYGILDTDREAAYDDVTRLIARICEAPIAVINLIESDRQWFKSEVGLGVSETPLETSFCRHALLENDRLVVPDATKDPRFECNPLVTAQGGLRFYAGTLLKTESGLPLGTLCVLDDKPRPEGLTDLQSEALTVLARQVMNQLELHRSVLAGARAVSHYRARETRRDDQDADRDVQTAVRDQRDVEMARVTLALAESEAKFRAISDSMPQMVWSTLPDGFHDYYNARWYEFTGVPDGSTDGEGWNGMFHPEDQERAWIHWRHSLATGEPYEIEYRLRHRSGVYRWTLGRALPIRGDDGEIIRWFGTCTDIEDLKRHEQAREVVSQELSHRVKNVFAVVSALVTLSARRHPEASEFAQSLKTRIQALARAHEFVRPHTASAAPDSERTTLHAFLSALLAPYRGEGGETIIIEGEDAIFDDQAATPVALLFHELATNAAKYGALSVLEGRVTVRSGYTDDGFRLTWIEEGGPHLDGPPQTGGFGFTLARLAVEGQLGGKLERRWEPTGLRLMATLPVTALQRRRHAAEIGEPKRL